MDSFFKPAKVMLPRVGTEMNKWSVVACDQYTSEPDYWENVENYVGEAPSSLRISLPEIYLSDGDVDKRIEKINCTMTEYVKSGVLEEKEEGYIYVERTQSDGRVRHGIIGMVDLLQYDFSRNSQSPIRATEGTVLERIPPRVKVRRDALLEMPHIMLLIDDYQKTVIEPLEKNKKDLKKLYDFKLMQNGGRVCGYAVTKPLQEQIDSAVEVLCDKKTFADKYGTLDKDVLVFAVGDGNHSLATARQTYLDLKDGLSEEEWLSLPSRYALCEIVNLYDPALTFEPIHRIVTGVNPTNLLIELCCALNASDRKFSGDCQEFVYVQGGVSKKLYINNMSSNLAVGSLQNFLDKYIKENGCKIDYIHGEDVLLSLTKAPDSIGFILYPMNKTDLFKTVVLDGVLPRKTFSIGHATDKRFYLECRKIK